MLRLLFTSVAITPIAIIPWMSPDADVAPTVSVDTSYSEQHIDPNLQALSECQIGELPIFFHDTFVTTHTAEYLKAAMMMAEPCDQAEIIIVPVLPEYADASDIGQSILRAAELAEFVDAAASLTDLEVNIDIASRPVEEKVSTLYMNGRAAILRIEPYKG